MDQIIVTAIALTIAGLILYGFSRWHDLAQLGSDVAARREARKRERKN